VALDLAHHVAAAGFRRRDHAVDALDLVDARRERARPHALHREAGAGEVPVGLLDGAGLPRRPPARKLPGNVPLQRAGEHLLQPLIGGGGDELSLETAQAKHLPGEIDDIARPHLLEEIRGCDRCRHARQKFPIGRPILARDQRRPAERVRGWRASGQQGGLRRSGLLARRGRGRRGRRGICAWGSASSLGLQETDGSPPYYRTIPKPFKRFIPMAAIGRSGARPAPLRRILFREAAPRSGDL